MAFLVSISFAHAAPGKDYVVDPAHVQNVYDGDTFYIVVPECAELLSTLCDHLGVRVNGIDTPEMHGKCQWERDHALAAKAVTVAMIKNAKSIVLTHVEREKYGRLLANVEIDGVDLGAALINGGYAKEYHGAARTGWCKKRTTVASAPAPLPMKTAP